MTSSLRLVVSAFALAASAVLVAGCAGSPASPAPTSTGDPGSTVAPGTLSDEVEAVWLDGGRMFAVVTQGSSSCVPGVGSVSAEGQTLRVTLDDRKGSHAESDEDEIACTDDLATRASLGMTPEGVDPTADVELVVTYGDSTEDVDLDGNPQFTAAPGTMASFEPSATWFDDRGLVLLTWGSSSCPPAVDTVEESANAATVTFQSADGICTMDMAPRATVLTFSQDVDESGFQLTLVGDNLDGTVTVLGD